MKKPAKKQFLAGFFVYGGVISFAAGEIGLFYADTAGEILERQAALLYKTTLTYVVKFLSLWLQTREARQAITDLHVEGIIEYLEGMA